MREQEKGYSKEQLSNANALIDLLDGIPESRREMVVLMALSFVRGMETQEGLAGQTVESCVK